MCGCVDSIQQAEEAVRWKTVVNTVREFNFDVNRGSVHIISYYQLLHKDPNYRSLSVRVSRETLTKHKSDRKVHVHNCRLLMEWGSWNSIQRNRNHKRKNKVPPGNLKSLYSAEQHDRSSANWRWLWIPRSSLQAAVRQEVKVWVINKVMAILVVLLLVRHKKFPAFDSWNKKWYNAFVITITACWQQQS